MTTADLLRALAAGAPLSPLAGLETGERLRRLAPAGDELAKGWRPGMPVKYDRRWGTVGNRHYHYPEEGRHPHGPASYKPEREAPPGGGGGGGGEDPWPFPATATRAEAEHALRREEREHFVIFRGPDGPQVARFRAERGKDGRPEKQVAVTPDLVEALAGEPNAVVVHNHISGSPPSPGDIIACIEHNVAVLRVLSPDGAVWVLRRSGTAWQDPGESRDAFRKRLALALVDLDAVFFDILADPTQAEYTRRAQAARQKGDEHEAGRLEGEQAVHAAIEAVARIGAGLRRQFPGGRFTRRSGRRLPAGGGDLRARDARDGTPSAGPLRRAHPAPSPLTGQSSTADRLRALAAGALHA